MQLFVGVLFSAALSGVHYNNPREDAAYVLDSLAHQSQSGIVDAYRWISDACLLGQHPFHNIDEAKDQLDSDWTALSNTDSSKPMVVYLRPDRQLVRLNLAAYKASGGTEWRLLQACYQSAKHFHSDHHEFIAEWKQFGQALTARPLRHVGHDEWLKFDRLDSPKRRCRVYG